MACCDNPYIQPMMTPTLTIECSICGDFICTGDEETQNVLSNPVCRSCRSNGWYDKFYDEMDDRIEDAFLRECHED